MAHHALTTEQMKNLEGAKEICDCPLVPQWQRQFEAKNNRNARKTGAISQTEEAGKRSLSGLCETGYRNFRVAVWTSVWRRMKHSAQMKYINK